jgi:hypothetical protein
MKKIIGAVTLIGFLASCTNGSRLDEKKFLLREAFGSNTIVTYVDTIYRVGDTIKLPHGKYSTRTYVVIR